MSLLRSAAKLTDALAANHAPPMPPAIIKTATPIISPIVKRLDACVSVPALALSMTDAISLGITTSPTTSMIMHSGPKMKKSR